MKIAVIGGGNGGQAMAGHLALTGHDVRLYLRNKELLATLRQLGTIELRGRINGSGKIGLFTDDLKEAVIGAEAVMIVTTATAHGDLAQQLAPILEDGQVVILNPGRTGGAMEFRYVLTENGCCAHPLLAEAQTLVYACRTIRPGVVDIIGVKDKVLLSALPAPDTEAVMRVIRRAYSCFIPVQNVLYTSLENIGAIFHPGIVIFNAAGIERGKQFYFYRDMTPSIAEFIEAMDRERLTVGAAYGIKLISAKDWVSFAYGHVEGETLCERMKNNPAYHNILAPTRIDTRQIMEDIPTGILPLTEFGRIAGVEVPIMKSVLSICSILLRKDFRKTGRTLERMGLGQCGDTSGILQIINHL